MEEYKKLFQRDKRFWLCVGGLVALILVFGLLNCQRLLQQLSEMNRTFTEAYGEEVSKEIMLGLGDTSEMLMEYSGISVIWIVFAVVILAQFIKWCVLEGKRGKEFGNLLPIKSVTAVIYDYICGILFLWLPVVLEGTVLTIFTRTWELAGVDSGYVWRIAVKAIVLFSFLYALLVFAKKITRYMPGTLLTTAVICFGEFLLYRGAGLSGGTNLAAETGGLLVSMGTGGCLLLLVQIPVLVALSFWCDGKRDIAGGGLFYFKSVHFAMIGLIFLELFLVCVNSILILIQVRGAAYAAALVLAAVVSAGVHHLTWGREKDASVFAGVFTGRERGRNDEGKP